MDVQAFYALQTVPEALKPWVRRILFAHGDTPVQFTTAARPTGYNYIGWFVVGCIVTRYDGLVDYSAPGAVHISGQITRHDVRMEYDGPTCHILAELAPGGLYTLTGVKGCDVFGKLVRLNRGLDTFQDAFAHLAGVTSANRVPAAFAAFLAALAETSRAAPALVGAFSDIAERSHGRVRIADAADQIGVSTKTLSSTFQSYVGVPPKLFCRILQLNHALTALMAGDEPALSGLAAEAGFSDQSHFNRTLQDFFQQSPLAFLESDKGILPVFLSRR